jgi:amidase
MKGVPFLAVLATALCMETGFAYEVEEKSVEDLQQDLSAGRVTSEQLVEAYLQCIERLDRSGPSLRSVISVNPDAREQARRLDKERRAGKVRSRLHGIPVLLKDSIESADRMPTTAGSLALQNNITHRDSGVSARLRAAGAIILGKTNLGEWSEIRSNFSISGWSAVGGLVKNPYVLDRSACGLSSGSGTAVAASLAPLAVGTETDNSIICPSSATGLVGLKPTVGLVSRSGIVPISASQDTAGPMARNVADVAALLFVMAGRDARDAATAEADARKVDYPATLNHKSLEGRRLGVLSYATGRSPAVDAVFESALVTLRKLGAVVVPLDDFKPDPTMRSKELSVMLADFEAALNDYLRTTAPGVDVKSLDDVVTFNRASARELALFGQDLLEAAQAGAAMSSAERRRLHTEIRRMAGIEGIDRLLSEHRLDALIAPSLAPAWRIDSVRGDHPSLGVSNLPAIAGYPHLTVPMGHVGPLPVGLSFIGAAWSDGTLLSMGHAFEQAARARQPPRYLESIEAADAMRGMFVPGVDSRSPIGRHSDQEPLRCLSMRSCVHCRFLCLSPQLQSPRTSHLFAPAISCSWQGTSRRKTVNRGRDSSAQV